MENLKSVKDRMHTVDSLIKTTNAMKMVSTVKMAKFGNVCKFSRECAEKLFEMLSLVLGNLIFEEKLEDDHWLLSKNKNGKILVLVLSASRGFCGAFNNSVINEANKLISHNKNCKIKIFGKKAAVVAPTEVIDIEDWFNIQSFSNKIYEIIMDNLTSDRISRIMIVSGKHKNSLVQKAEASSVFPLSIEKIPRYVKVDEDEVEIAEQLFQSYMTKLLNTVIVEHINAELAARVMAMDNSVRNARDMYDNLNMIYNRSRQAKITQELAEIVNSMDSVQ
ncbi:MAG: F0F1 ATP synthase subunit gamma [Holosporales bacterium]|jgi:F-type H+-transporting ATPase subunit gamma|nr:F0F1 ATP synthase subunit gamma [Holosporales bacterium]